MSAKVTVVVRAFGGELLREELTVQDGMTVTLHADDRKAAKLATETVVREMKQSQAQFRVTGDKG